jgi:transglutaminase-like putative cysteine protease
MKKRPPITQERRTEAPVESTGQLLWLVFAVMVAGAPHLLFVHPWVPVTILALIAWRIIAALKRWKLPGLAIRLPLTLIGFLAVLFSYRKISGLDAGSALLLVMISLKLLETRGHRDRAVVVFICYFLLFAAFLREQPIWSGAYLLAGVLVTTAALVQTARSGTVVTATRVMGMSLRLVLQAIPLMVLLFFLFPRIPGPFWALPHGGTKGMTGLANDLTPGDITELALSDEVAFRVRFDSEPPAPSELYWRGPVMNRFDGRTWAIQQMSFQPQLENQVFKNGSDFSYELTLEPHGRNWLLALETPAVWTAPQAQLTTAFQLVNPTPVNQRMSYRGRSFTGGSIPAVAMDAASDRATILPEGSNLKSIEFARRLRTEADSDRDFLLKVLEFFTKEEFYYTLTPALLGLSPVDEFLFTTRQGFCGHYASAFTLLARAAGIPARVVTGYQGAEFNPLGNYWIVRQSNAHAWTEAWLDGRWVRFDPTAAVAPERIEMGFNEAMDWSSDSAGNLLRTNSFISRLALSWDAVNTGWNRWVLSFGPKSQETMMSIVGIEKPSMQYLTVALGISTTLFLLIMGILQRRSNRPRVDTLQKSYQILCARIGLLSRQRRPSEGPQEYADAVCKLRPDLAAELEDLFTVYVRLRYGAPTDEQSTQNFLRAVEQFRPGAKYQQGHETPEHAG